MEAVMRTTMKKIFQCCALCLSLALPSLAQAHGDLGLGVVLGDPSGLSGKVWMDSEHAIDFSLGTFGYYVGQPYTGINVHADYLWHRYGVFGNRSTDVGRKMPLYIGAGGLLASPGVVGARGVVGVTYLFDQPFDVFLELAPTLILAPGPGFGIDLGLGGRFYF
jgi:hypothetical protein